MTKKKIMWNEDRTWVRDENDNMCSADYFGSEAHAEAALKSLKWCTRCMNCKDCVYCSGCFYCKDCMYCSGCSYCTGCSYCKDCMGCMECLARMGNKND